MNKNNNMMEICPILHSHHEMQDAGKAIKQNLLPQEHRAVIIKNLSEEGVMVSIACDRKLELQIMLLRR
jgi:hypothetical protein